MQSPPASLVFRVETVEAKTDGKTADAVVTDAAALRVETLCFDAINLFRNNGNGEWFAKQDAAAYRAMVVETVRKRRSRHSLRGFSPKMPCKVG
jgi:hypothetical protein